MEIERLKALKAEDEREKLRAEAQRRGAAVIIEQIKEREVQRVKEREQLERVLSDLGCGALSEARVRDAWSKLSAMGSNAGSHEVSAELAPTTISFADFGKWWHSDGVTCVSWPVVGAVLLLNARPRPHHAQVHPEARRGRAGESAR